MPATAFRMSACSEITTVPPSSTVVNQAGRGLSYRWDSGLPLCCMRSRMRGEMGMNSTISLVIAVLVIILLVVLILQFV